MGTVGGRGSSNGILRYGHRSDHGRFAHWHGGGSRREPLSSLVHAPNKARTRAYVLLIMKGITVHRISPMGVAENALEFQSREGCASTKHAQRAPDFSSLVTGAIRCTLLSQPELSTAS